MENRPMTKSFCLTGHEKVDAIAQVNFSGDITPRSWYKHICYKTSKGDAQKVDRLAIDILADIVYWYRPYEKRDEISGEFLGWRKKFSESLLRRSPDAFAESLNATVRCVRESIRLLEHLGLITVTLAPVKTEYGTLPNVMYIDINPEAIASITYQVEYKNAETLEKSLLTKWVTSNDEMSNKELRNRQHPTTKSSTSDYEIVNLSIYRDFSKSSLEISAESLPSHPKNSSEEAQDELIKILEEREVFNHSSVAIVPDKPICQSDRPLPSAIIPARENHSQATADRVRQTWLETGVLPRIPMELDAWAWADIGRDVISAYRKSGRISTTKRGDIIPDFALYVASQWKGKDVDYGYSQIKKLEKDPNSWEVLASLVAKWISAQKTGDRNLNIAQSIEKETKPKITHKLF